MQNKNKISVVIPTYNSINNIGKTLKSLEYQTRSPDEIIFSDDGSEDRTVEVLKKWMKENPKFNTQIIKNEHLGPGN